VAYGIIPFFILTMEYCVYKITNLLNERFYIGVTSIDRFNNGYFGSGKLIRRAVKKYGKENFDRCILRKFELESDAYDYEREIVNSEAVENPNCYNMVEGGGHPPKLYGSKNPSFGKDLSGPNHPNYRKRPPDDVIERIRLSGTLYETGHPGWWVGKTRDEGVREKISKTLKDKHILPPNARGVVQYSMDGAFIKNWRSIGEAVAELKIYKIWDVCNGKRNHAGGYFWRYADEQ
jgi:hypothetical protein